MVQIMESLTILTIKLFWLFLPAGIANMSPVFFRRLSILNIPIDFNKKLGREAFFGPNKTYRGFLVGLILSIGAVYLQKILYPYLKAYSFVDYSQINFLLLGFLLGFGALFGDLIKSFIKRRFGILAGKSWIPFDQIDWIIGAIILTYLLVPMSPKEILIIFVLFGILHPVVNFMGYILQLKPNKF